MFKKYRTSDKHYMNGLKTPNMVSPPFTLSIYESLKRAEDNQPKVKQRAAILPETKPRSPKEYWEKPIQKSGQEY